MLQTIEATINPKGIIRFSEDIHITKSLHVLVTILEPSLEEHEDEMLLINQGVNQGVTRGQPRGQVFILA